ncbi:hypothetical protein [Gracilinema caldarium]|uniref:hypothetical protein n=1 Tax=Gracilinema caldarium TaxID=215591 RepID=UPI0026EC47E5|nr:hypothetical protein [Gracilinema caldarium]
MDIKSAMLRLLRSPLGLLVMSLNLLGAVLAILLFHFPLVVVVPVFLIIALVDIIMLLQTEPGARSVIAEQDRERAERDARILGGVAAARKRLGLLRLDPGPVKDAVDRLVYAAGLYLEATIKGSDRDPVVEDAILGAIETVDTYLHQVDMIKNESMFTFNKKDVPAETAYQDSRIETLASHTGTIIEQAVEAVFRRLENL